MRPPKSRGLNIYSVAEFFRLPGEVFGHKPVVWMCAATTARNSRLVRTGRFHGQFTSGRQAWSRKWKTVVRIVPHIHAILIIGRHERDESFGKITRGQHALTKGGVRTASRVLPR